MPITVQGPNGVTIDFPDGTDHATIDGVMRQAVGGAASAPASAAPQQNDFLSETLPDVAKSAGIGLVNGALGFAGTMGNIRDLTREGAAYLAGKVSGKPTTETRPLVDQATAFMDYLPPFSGPSTPQLQKMIEGATGTEFYKPQTMPGEYARTIGEFAPAALTPGSWVRKGAQVLAPAFASETAGQVTKGEASEPYARVLAAMVAPAGTAMLRRAVTPLPISPERQAMVDVLTREGVPVTAGQASGSKALQYAESALGDAPGSGGAVSRTLEQQGDRFTAAAMRRVGENVERAGPQEVDDAFRRIGQNFDDLSARNYIVMDRQLADDLNRAVTEYHGPMSVVPVHQQSQAVMNAGMDIANRLAVGGALTGEVYQGYRSMLDRMRRAAQANDPHQARALRGMVDALDDAMERTIARTNPDDLGAFREARRQYRNMLVIENAATGAGENAAFGRISPAKLRQAVVAQNKRDYVRGQGDFGELTRAGNALMTPLPQSGTGPRVLMQGIPAALGATAGFTAGGMAPGVAAGVLASQVTPGLLGRVLMSAPAQNYLRNQAAQPPTRMSRAIARALIASEAVRPLLGGP